MKRAAAQPTAEKPEPLPTPPLPAEKAEAIAKLYCPDPFEGHPDCACCERARAAARAYAPAIFAALYWTSRGATRAQAEIKNRIPLRDLEAAEDSGLLKLSWSRQHERTLTQSYTAAVTADGWALLKEVTPT